MDTRLLRRFALALVLLACGCAVVRPAPQSSLAEMLAPAAAQWHSPVRLTARAGGTLEGDYHEGRRRLAYASRETGDAEIWLQEDAPFGLQPPRVLAPHSARDRGPRLSPDGRRVLFVSSRADTAGDIWLVDLDGGGIKRRVFGGKDLRRLTGSETADDQPCWHPEGKRVFFASAESLRDPRDLWQLDLKDAARARLTTGGGQMPDCSPDGRYLVFARRGDAGGVGISVIRLSDGAQAMLTDGTCIDVLPCWASDGRQVLFARYAVDTDADGDVDRDDAASVFSATFDEGIFGGKPLPPVRQLTSWACSDPSPRPLEGGFLFASDRAPGGGRPGSSFNLWALPMSGEAPTLGRVSEFMRFARRQEGAGGADAWRRLLAWQNALWAARESTYSDRVEFDLPAWGDAAEASLRTAELLLELGRIAAARETLRGLRTEFPDSVVFGGLARVRLLELDRGELAARPAQDAGPGWQEHLADAQKLLDEYRTLMQSAEEGTLKESAPALGNVCALAQLGIGLTHYEMKQYPQCLEALGRVADDYPDSTEACARALLETARVFQLLGEPETVRQTQLRLLRGYPDAEPYAGQAAALVVDGIVGSGQLAPEEKLAALRALIEEHQDERVLPALAQNRIGDLFYQARDYLRARDAYRRTIEQYPRDRRQVAAAHLALATIQTDQEDFGAALETYAHLSGEIGESGRGRAALRRRALDGFINATLMKAQKELDAGDVRLALGTYGLIDFDPRLPAGHRGLVDCLARLGRTDEAIVRYREALKRDARDDVPRFSLARAYSYYGPEDWVGNRSAARRRAAIDREALKLVGQGIMLRYDVSYYHQLRGFLFSRVALAAGEDEARVQALDSYVTALGLSDPARDRVNHANLLFNVAEGYRLVGQDENACDYYETALAAGFSLEGERGDAALEDISRSALARGSYELAAQMLRRALDRLSGPLPDDDGKRHVVLVRRAGLLDQMALTHYLDGDYAAAARYYERTIEALRDLMAEHRAGRAGYVRNIVRAQRNQAVNIYHAVRSGALELDELERSYRLLLETVEEVERFGVVEWDEEAPGIITIDIQVALGEEGGLAKFDLLAERRLLYTYLARISAEAGDYAAAAGFLRKKLALYPELPRDTDRADLLSERGVVLSQLGDYLVRGGDLRGAADSFGEAMDFERRAGNLRGEMADCFSLGRLALRMAEIAHAKGAALEPDFRDWCAEIVQRHEELLARSASEGGSDLVQLRVSLGSNLAQLRARVGPIAAQEGQDAEGR